MPVKKTSPVKKNASKPSSKKAAPAVSVSGLAKTAQNKSKDILSAVSDVASDLVGKVEDLLGVSPKKTAPAKKATAKKAPAAKAKSPVKKAVAKVKSTAKSATKKADAAKTTVKKSVAARAAAAKKAPAKKKKA